MTFPLLIFAKAPVAGTVKTRLIPALGPDGACDLYTELFERTLQQTADWPGERYLYCAPDDSHPFFIDAAQRHRLHRRTQCDGDLGARMLGAMEQHPAGALLIGTDCPQLEVDHLQQAADALASHDIAVLPSEDGGYVLVGQSRPHPAPFTAMTWSHAEVLKHTRRRVADAGLSLWVGPTLWDIDEPEEIARYRALRCDHP